MLVVGVAFVVFPALACSHTEPVDDEGVRLTDWGEMIAVQPAEDSPFAVRDAEGREPLEAKTYPHETLPRLGLERLTSITGEEVSDSELPIPADEALPSTSEMAELPGYYVTAFEREARLWRVLKSFLGEHAWQRPGTFAQMRAHGLEVHVPAAAHRRVERLLTTLREEERREQLVDVDVRVMLVEPEALRPFATAFPLREAATQGLHMVVRRRDATAWLDLVLDEEAAREVVSTRLTMQPGQAENTQLLSQRRFVRYHEPASNERYRGDGASHPAFDTDQRGFTFFVRAVPETDAGRVTLAMRMELSPAVPFGELPLGDGERQVHLPLGTALRQELNATVPLEHTFMHILPDALIDMDADEEEQQRETESRKGALILIVTPRLIDGESAAD